MSIRNKILIVNDNEVDRNILKVMIPDEYGTLEACDGVEALDIISTRGNDLAVILLDIIMPRIDGIRVLEELRARGILNYTPVIITSAIKDEDILSKVYELGAIDYITEPFDKQTVEHRIHNAILLYTKEEKIQKFLVENEKEQQHDNYQIIELLTNLVQTRENGQDSHVASIRVITNLVLQQLKIKFPKYGLSQSSISLISTASILHDIGKISIPSNIITKASKLTQDEYDIIKLHTIKGAEWIERSPGYKSSELLQEAYKICRWHHERFTGAGYPDGLVGNNIPLSAQAVGISEVYEALTTDKSYRPGYSDEDAVKMIISGKCGEFNPDLIECIKDIGPLLKEEVTIHSLLAKDVERIVYEITTFELDQVSESLLSMLEEERARNKLLESITKELQFEYDYDSDTIKFSDWGAKYFKLDKVISNPFNNSELLRWSNNAYLDIKKKVESMTITQPIITERFLLAIGNTKQRWYKIVMRGIYNGEGNQELRKIIGKIIDIHDEQVKLEVLQGEAETDPLTGLYNRRAAYNKIEKELSLEPNGQYMLLMIDLDYFKQANDTYGHAFGDEVLKCVADSIKSHTRSSDIAARIGGDEYIIMMNHKGNAELLAKRLYDAISINYKGFQIRISMGIGLYPEHATDYSQWLNCADIALYKVKEHGRSHYKFYEPGMTKE